MQDLITENYVKDQVQQFNVTDAGIAELNKQYADLKIKDFNDVEGYKIVKKARLHVREIRCELENKRKELVEKPKNIAKQIDAEAKRRKEQLSEIEKKLSVQEDEYEAEQERLKKEKLAAAAKKFQSRVAMLNEIGFKFDGNEFTFDKYLYTTDDLRDFNEEQFECSLIEPTLTAERIKQAAKEAQEKSLAEAAIKAAEEANAKAQRDEELRKQREELDRKQMAIDIERARIQKEREEKQAEIDKLNQEKHDLVMQRIEMRRSLLKDLGVEVDSKGQVFKADFFDGQQFICSQLDNCSDSEFTQILGNFRESKNIYLERIKTIKEAYKEIEPAVQKAYADSLVHGEVKIDIDTEPTDIIEDKFQAYSRFQSLIKESVCAILELYDIPVNEVTFNVSELNWNIEHKGCRLFSCNIGQYIKTVRGEK